MTAFFFGPTDRQLFGYYHPPRGTGTGAVVVCPSWGPEYQYAHRALRVTARRLAERGLHVLRFDYSGTGDSWGKCGDAELSRWIADTGLAIEELKVMSGIARVDLLGLRLGAFVAGRTAASRSDIRRLILWDPVIDGRSWVRELSPEGPAPVTGASAAGADSVEFANRLVSRGFVASLEELHAAAYAGSRPDASLLLETTADDGHRYAALHAAIPGLQRRLVEDAQPWREDMSIWSGIVPAKAIAAIGEWIGSGNL